MRDFVYSPHNDNRLEARFVPHLTSDGCPTIATTCLYAHFLAALIGAS